MAYDTSLEARIDDEVAEWDIEVGNPDNLVGVQAGIQCVQDAPGAADTEVQLQMAITIPGQRGNTIAEGQIQLVQSICHLARALGYLLVGVTVNVAFNTARNYLGLAMVPVGEFNQRRNQQLLVLHQPEHGYSFWKL